MSQFVASPLAVTQFVELGNMSSFALAVGINQGDRAVIVDNLRLASPSSPIVLSGAFNVGASFLLTAPGQSVSPFWDGSVWVMA